MMDETEFEESLDAEVQRVRGAIEAKADVEMPEGFYEELREILRRGSDPRQVLERKLSESYPGKSYDELPPEDRESRAIWLMKVQLDLAVASLKVIAERELSTEENPIYAGAVESPGNRIHTPAEMAKSSLEEIERYLLKPKFHGA